MSAARNLSVGEFTDEQLRVQRTCEALHRDGASPAGALELLASIVEDRTWERVADKRGRSFVGRFREFVEARAPFGLGFDADQLPKVLALRHPHESVPEVAYRMAAMREQVRALLRDEIPVAPGPGRPVRLVEPESLPPADGTEEPERNMSGTHVYRQDSHTASAITARLKRDDPALAEKVVRGEVTPNAAAREKGWRKPRIVLSTPERVAASLRKWMPRDALAKLAALLSEDQDQQ